MLCLCFSCCRLTASAALIAMDNSPCDLRFNAAACQDQSDQNRPCKLTQRNEGLIVDTLPREQEEARYQLQSRRQDRQRSILQISLRACVVALRPIAMEHNHWKQYAQAEGTIASSSGK